MRIGVLTAALSAMALAGCASAGHGGMGHGAMTHEDMMRHCQMMEQHQSEGARAQPNMIPRNTAG